MVGNALGNRTEENIEEEISVLHEDNPNIITYSKSSTLCLYSYANKKYSNLTIPYKTIKVAKQYRSNGVREFVYDVFHRPDKSPLLRTMLDLWGFDSYVDYLYTVCELGFLEGLIPVIDFGFLSPDELKKLYDVFAIVKNPLYSDYDELMHKEGIRDLDMSSNIHQKLLSWSSKLKYPTSTGFFIHEKLSMSSVKYYSLIIAEAINSHDSIHEVVLTTKQRTDELPLQKPSLAKQKKFYETVRELIPDNIPVIITEPDLAHLDMLISNGERDLGSFDYNFLNSNAGQKYWAELNDKLTGHSLKLAQRFPLRKAYIKHQRYSKKLGQVFDSYKYKIKKDLLEKQKEAR